MKMIRVSYKVIRNKYKKIGKGSVRLTQSSLLLEKAINATSDTYKFPVLETDPGDNVGGAHFAEEIRLNQNDEFVAYEVAYYVVADKLPTPEYDPTQVTGRFFFPYAPDELDSAAQNLEDAWLGNLQILVNKISRLERWDLKKHNYIPRTQFQSNSPGIPSATQPSIDYSEAGTYPMQPMLTLSGAKKNDLIISLIHSIPSTVIASWLPGQGTDIVFHFKRLSLIFRGMLAQNAASFQK